MADAIYADIEDFEARHGDLSEADQETVEALLEDASALVAAEAGDSAEEWLTDSSSEPPREVSVVCIAMAYRAWRDPDGVSRERLGAAEVEYRADVPDSIWLTDNERRTVQRAAKIGSFKAVTLETPYSGSDIEDLPDLPL
jgi:hypothetical protein